MKEIYKNPNFYYILVPAMLALWPLIAGGVYLPAAERGLKDEMKDYQKARSRVDEILKLLELDVEKLAAPIRRTNVQWLHAASI